MLSLNKLYLGDCLEVMQEIDNNSINLILYDLPYGVTSNSWDSLIPLDQLWKQYERILANNGRVVLFAAQPFTSVLISSNLANFKHTWTWIKSRPTGFQNAKKMPLRATEDICVFYGKTYNPQGLVRINKVCKNSQSSGGSNVRGDVAESTGKGSLRTPGKEYVQEFTNYPKNILEYGLDEGNKIHPTQKPLALCEYLIKTYSNEKDLVLDNCAGSGTSLVAANNQQRNFIGIEKDKNYFEVAKERISEL